MVETGLSIIIVHYKTPGLLKNCLASIYTCNSHLNFEVIIVDNASGDDSRGQILPAFPLVRWIQMTYNAGFARANNEGMRQAAGKVLLLLNPDTLIIENAIEKCYRQLIDSAYVAAGVQILDIACEPQISGSFFVKGGLNHLLPLPYWGNFLRWIGYSAKMKIPNVKVSKAIEEVDWISGAFLMVKRQAIEKAGLMDEDFFLYAEEVEWCGRLKKIGKLCIFGNLHIIHLEGHSINQSLGTDDKGYYNLYNKKGLQLMVSNHLRVRKQYGVGWFLFLLLNYTWGVFFFFVCSTFYHLFRIKNPFSEWKKVAQMAGNVLRLWSLSPRIIGNKPYFYKMM